MRREGGGLGKVTKAGSLINILQTVRSQPCEFPKVEMGRRVKGERFQRQGRPNEICSVNISNNFDVGQVLGQQ